jgi:hypothetical protein
MRSSAVRSVVVFLTVLLAGCAVNYDYRAVVADIGFSGTASVSVAVHDQRAYVLSGDKRPDYVGLVRGGFGNPFFRSTLSGRPLADDMTAVIATSLAKRGYKTVSVNVSHSDRAAAVLDALKAVGTDRMLLLRVNEWKSDLNPYNDVTLFYSMQLALYDHDGKILAEKKIEGRESLGGDVWGPAAYARKAAPEAFKKKIEELLSGPDIAKALQ